MELKDKKIVVVGLGATGFATAKFLRKRGADVTATDLATEQDLGECIQCLREMDIHIELGQHRNQIFENADLIVPSPGVPHTIRPITRAQENGISVMGEIELAARFIQEPIVAVTGTNGKTTTTTLLGEMLKRSGLKVFVGGNIGRPLIDYVDGNEKAQVVVAEISSFQLDTIVTFRPKVGVLLNISEDHMDRYPDFAAYARSKIRIFENQLTEDTAVLNGSDPLMRSMAQNIKSRKLYFNTQAKTEKGATINNQSIIFNLKDSGHHRHKGLNLSLNQNSISQPANRIMGQHQLENIAAAGLAALAAGGELSGLQSALNDFRGLSHRVEYVNTINNVEYFNDSKATNVDAVAKALECFKPPVILILGGRNKGGHLQALAQPVRRHVKEIIALGEAKQDIISSLERVISTTPASSMEDAVFKASQVAVPGDIVLLSPACASFDMYDNYAHRGEDFCKAVHQLKKKML
jgi:UDP-N-acetylmuramoylalanine--D-glutamate ligase